ncbi:MAG: TonB-dependent receptor [Pyrinomonadaceae bacterium]
MRKLVFSFVLLFVGAICSVTVQAQTTGSMSGTVTDQNGALVGGATVTARNNATGAERVATTSSAGLFAFEALQPGSYTITVENTGFKKYVATNNNVAVAQNSQLSITLEIGLEGETVTVTSAQDVINTASPSLTSTINTRQVVDLPLPTRNPLELAGLQAGIAVTGTNVRGSSIAGLRQTATNVTQDGINAMDNFVKTSSLFAISTPSLNSTAEFSITTGTVGSDQGRGVGQVTLVTKGGTNDFHGGLFYMNRNDALQANSFFNNALGTERPRQNQHFFGFDIGGPVYFLGFGEGGKPWWDGKDKAHFFFAYEGFRDNFSVTRNRTVLTPEARQGIFRYARTCPTAPPDPNCSNGVQSVNLLAIGNQNQLNPITMAILNNIPDPNNADAGDGFNTGGYRFNVSGVSNNDKYVARYDHQLVKDTFLGSHKFEFVFNYFKNILSPDTFNSLEAPFPGGVNSAQGGPRWLVTGALVSNFGSNINNVFRVGKQWAPVGFLLESDPTEPFIGFQGITSPYAGGGFLSQGRDTQVWQVSDNVSWSKGNHLFKFGGDYQRIFAYTFNDAGINQTITLGTPSHNNGGILDTSFPGSSSTIRTNARNIFANLTGNLSVSAATLNVATPTSGFVLGATRERVFLQKDLALYAQDQWRMRSNFTVNYGVRWDFMGVPTIPNGLAIQLTDPRHIFGISGFGNLFNPNAPAGAAPAVGTLDFVSGDTGKALYNDDWDNFAPFVGFAWSPGFDGGIGKALFGSPGRSAIRAGYSMSFLRDGFTTISNALGVGTTNPGLITSTSTASNPITGVLTSAGVTLPIPTFAIPRTDRDNFLQNPNNGLWAIDPDLRIPFVHQFSFGYEREIFKDTAFEIRYSGNRGKGVWRAVDYNEINIFENGFLDEFRRAQSNLAINAANGSPNNFGNVNPGLGTVPLPIFSAFFVGASAGNSFQNATFISHLNNNNVGSIAATLANSATYRAARENPANGIPANFFIANPNARFARMLTNDSGSQYDSLQVELRRRFSGGLQFQADYTFSKALTDAPEALGNNQSTLENFRTLRDKSLDWSRSTADQTHRFVTNALYDLPFGKGRRWLNSNEFINQVFGGWTIGGIASWSTNPPFFITSGRTSFNAWPVGTEAANLPAQLVGMTFEQFMSNVGIYRTPGGIFWFNPDLLNVSTNSSGRVTGATLQAGLLGQPDAGTFGNFPKNSINAGKYFNLDMSVVKRFPIGERVKLELKTTFINILNNVNFSYGTTQFDSTQFGRITGTRSGARVIHFQGSMRF